MSTAVLAALRIRAQNWIETVQTSVKRKGHSAERNGSRIDVWDAKHRLDDGYFADGWRLRKLWLGSCGNAVAICPYRFYFSAEGSIDRRPERDIVDLSQRPKTPLEKRLRALKQLLDDLREGCGTDSNALVRLNTSVTDLLDGVTLQGARQAFPADTKLYNVYKRGGFFDSPDKLEVLLCCDNGVSTDHTDDYCRHVHRFSEYGFEATFHSTTLAKLENRLNAIDQGDTVKRRDVPTLFMLAGRQMPPSDRLRQIMQRFDQHDIPWRRAYATDDREWSVGDQLGSLLQAGGGYPHLVTLAGGECRLPWSIGIDLSHRKDFSRVAATLIGTDGRLAGAWTHDQERREDIKPAVLRRLLTAAMTAMPISERSSGVLVVRDGRVFESENVEDYRRDFNGPVTLVELRKRGNPPLLLGEEWQSPKRPTVAWLPEAAGGSLGFIVTLPQSAKNEFDGVMKIWMRDEWDGMNIGREHLARILAAQTLTPGLGLHPRRLPASIYWADGIAGTSDEDLRFRGQPVMVLD